MTQPEKNKRAEAPARRVDRLPEPARSVAREVLPQARENGGPSEQADEQATEQAEEWAASRAPGARPAPPTSKTRK